MVIQAKLRRWGNSFGIVVPAETLRMKHLKEGEEVLVEIEKKDSALDIFGSLKNWKIDSQKLKNKIREEEDG